MATSQDFVNWVCGENLSAPYLRYLFMLEQESVRRFAFGSVHPTLYFPDAKALHVLVPDRRRQDDIARVLQSLDDKMAANTKLISNLHVFQTALMHRSLAAASTQMQVGRIAIFHNKHRIPLSSRDRETRKGSVPYYGASGIFDFVDAALFDIPIVLVGEDGSVIREDGTPVTQYVWGPSWVNNHAHVLTGSSISTELLFVAISTSQVGELVTGAVQPKISMTNLKRLELELPVGDALSALEDSVASTMKSVRLLHEENRTLEVLRDSLLPELLSGKLRVRDAERAVSEVL